MDNDHSACIFHFAEGHLRSNKYLTGGHKGPIFSSQIGWGGIEDDHVPFMRRGNVLRLIKKHLVFETH